MIKTEISKFVQNIKLELENYEDISSEDIENWEKNFLNLLKANKISYKNLTRVNGKIFFGVYDEMEIFTIADDYCNAILNNDLKSYWNSFS